MAIEKGINGKLWVENSGSPGTYRELPGQRQGRLGFTVRDVDTSNKDSGDWGTFLGMFRDATITVTTNEINTPELDDLEKAFLSSTMLVNAEFVQDSSGAKYAGSFEVNDLSRDTNHDDQIEVNVSLKAASALTRTPTL